MAGLVGEVLAFSKAATLPEQEKPETFSLRGLIDAIVLREAPDREVDVRIPENLGLCTLRSALDRALGNILRNAVRYAGHADPVRIEAEEDGGQVVIRVTDQGPGVQPEALPRLFDAFYRPESARGRDSGGSGLGLAIARRCVEACGGTVSAELALPRGLCLVLRLPAAAVMPPDHANFR
jgi:two-component system sensor histidine kinase CpxA